MSTPTFYESTTLFELQELVSNIGRKCPELASRAESAAGLILAGKVRPDPDTAPDAYLVTGSTDKSGATQAYRVDLAGDCQCPDYEKRGIPYNGRRFCKHMLACLLVARLSRQAERCRGATRSARLQAFRPRQTRRPARVAAAA